ncbi:Shufflon-specific DNA recombinase [Candidatus Burkholderia brachyanthoides]|nr:Shufflon-specific DNA recombinase [Candidatus Burkholderia brachyanthoides]
MARPFFFAFSLVDSIYCANFAPLGLSKPWTQHLRSSEWHLSPVEAIFSGRPVFAARAIRYRSRSSTRDEAEAWARLIESEINRGVFVSRAEAESTTLAEALDRYDREIAASKNQEGLRAGSCLCCAFGRWKSTVWKSTVIASRPMISVRSADIAKLKDDWLKQTNPPLKPVSVVRRLAVLSHVFRKNGAWKVCSIPSSWYASHPPTMHAPAGSLLPKTDTESARQTEAGELERVVAASGSDLLPAIIWPAVETAMRRGEIVDLQREYVDLRRRVAHLPETKNGSSRDVPLSTRAVESAQGATKSCQDA